MALNFDDSFLFDKNCCNWFPRPSISFLAGRSSVYDGIPKEVLAAAFNVDPHTLEELGRDQDIIFPPYHYARKGKEQSRTRSHSQGEPRFDDERHSRYPQSPF